MGMMLSPRASGWRARFGASTSWRAVYLVVGSPILKSRTRYV
jgi:hypothetical protein